MNTHFQLFQTPVNYDCIYYNNALAKYMSEIEETCNASDNKEDCFAKQKSAFDFTFEALKSQLNREHKLDNKYERMNNYKTLRQDPDRKYKPFSY